MIAGIESFTPFLQSVAAASDAGEVCVPASVVTAVGGLITALLGGNAIQWKAAQKRNEQDRESARRMEERVDRLIDQEKARRIG